MQLTVSANRHLLGVAAGVCLFGVAPVVVGALRALGTRKAELLECVYWVELLGVRLELGPRQSFDFLHGYHACHLLLL